MYETLKIITYPDSRLRKASVAVTRFDEELVGLAQRMLELMREHKGVGLAAPQVGENIRLFVMNATGEPGDDRIYVNPDLSEAAGAEEAEEGCLSLPGINAAIIRDKSMRMRAQDLQGNSFEQTATGYVARIWQHEFDHLNGIMIIDRMGPVARMGYRKKLKEMEDEWLAAHPPARARKRA